MHHPFLCPAILSTLCSSLKRLGMLPVRAALSGQEWRLDGSPGCNSLPHLSSFHSLQTQPSYSVVCPSPCRHSSADRDNAGLAGFPPVAAILPPVVLVASYPSCSPGKAHYLSVSRCLDQAGSAYQTISKLFLRDRQINKNGSS